SLHPGKWHDRSVRLKKPIRKVPLIFPCFRRYGSEHLFSYHYFSRMIVEFFAPGTAPLITIMFCSGRIFTTRRFSTLTLSLPIRPAIRLPLCTREANEALPIEPGARCLS